jgi:hypothetical protein
MHPTDREKSSFYTNTSTADPGCEKIQIQDTG